MTRYIRWDYDANEAIEYERNGECNGCGACCIAKISFRVAGTYNVDNNNGGDGTTEKGVWTELVFDNEARRFWQVYEIDTANVVPCSALQPGYRCAFHNHANNLCTEWPLAPEHVTPFSDCSFTFTEINRWPIQETVP